MRILFTLTLLAAVVVAGAQPEQKVSSTIREVSVFLQGAEVTRQASVSLKPGVALLKLTGISPGIQQQSIQVQGPASVKILTVSFGVNYLDQAEKPEKTNALTAERKRLVALIEQEKSLADVYKEEEDVLMTNKSIGGTANGVEMAELKTAMDYFRQRLTDIKQQRLNSSRLIKEHEEALVKVDAQLRELHAKKEHPTGEILVKVSTKVSQTADFTVKYLVNEARWYPSYDVRAKDISSPVSITYKANVSQQSGEDWENVKLTISTADPSRDGARPILKPWIVGYNNGVVSRGNGAFGVPPVVANSMVRGRVVDDHGEPLPGINILIKGSSVGTVTDVNGYYDIPLTSDAQTLVYSFIGYQTVERPIGGQSEINLQLQPDVSELSEVVVTGYSGDRVSRGLQGKVPGIQIRGVSSIKSKQINVATPVVRQTNIEFTLDEPFTVKSDGEMKTTDMVEYGLKAMYEYYCAPKLDADAFLTAKILDWDQYNFLEGEASLFFEGKYIGKSILDTRNISDTLTLSLGRDGNVLVKREKKKDFSSRQVIGSNQKVTLGYEITVRNKKAQPITIVIDDQVPVPNDKDITVDKQEDSNAEYTPYLGLLRWKKDIAAGKTETIQLRYAVRYSKGNSLLLE